MDSTEVKYTNDNTKATLIYISDIGNDDGNFNTDNNTAIREQINVSEEVSAIYIVGKLAQMSYLLLHYNLHISLNGSFVWVL